MRVGFKPNTTVYAFTNLYAERGGKAVMVVDHAHELKVRLNGAVVYDNPDRGEGNRIYLRGEQYLYCIATK
jgi:hypothetical protein